MRKKTDIISKDFVVLVFVVLNSHMRTLIYFNVLRSPQLPSVLAIFLNLFFQKHFSEKVILRFVVFAHMLKCWICSD